MKFNYDLPIDVIKHLSNVVAKEFGQEPLVKLDHLIDLRWYDKEEINRCLNDFRNFFKNANGRPVYVKA